MLTNAIQSFLRLFGLRLAKASTRAMPVVPFDVLEYVVDKAVRESNGAFRFIQMGAGERTLGDNLTPLIQKHGIAGCIVEPRPSVREQLRGRLGDQPQLTFRDAALGTSSGETLALLCKHLGYENLNLLYVEANGGEDNVIYQALDAGIFPAIINYGWTCMPIGRIADLKLRLLDHGYRFIDVGGDTVCVRQ